MNQPHPIVVWVLIVLGPYPYTIQTFNTHGACVQAKYDYSRPVSNSPRRNYNHPTLICRQQVLTNR